MLRGFRDLAEGLLFLAMGCLVLLATGAFFWAVWPEGWRGEGAASWSSAVGTIAAAAIALCIALRDGTRRHHEEMIRAKLAAAGIAGQLESTVIGVDNAIARIVEWMNGDRNQYIDLLTLSARLNSHQMVGGSKLYDLVPLPNNCAHNLAASIDLVTRAVLNIPYAFGTNEAPAGTTKEELMHSCLADLRAAAPMVVSALKECRKASGFID